MLHESQVLGMKDDCEIDLVDKVVKFGNGVSPIAV